ncbi:hypothetical protein QJQ45_021130 [Haematococcus lacustris]|nr:hypothetical protein QJQ45_021130 [Haematococcus lacustris]
MATEVENEAQLPEVRPRCSSGDLDRLAPTMGHVEQIAKEEEKIAPHHDSNTKYRKDYKAPPFSVQTVDLDFILNEDVTQVHSTLTLVPQYPEDSAPPALVLNGRADVTLVSLKVNGSDWPAEQYSRSDKELQITGLPAGVLTLAITTHIKPQENSLLEGLYKSGGNYCTQCEAEGFRGITYFLDRPDVMAKYTTRIEADKASYPVLLGNGNLQSSGDLPGGRHFVVWEDPWAKPCYLFALVAGKLAMKERSFTTMSGRQVALRIFVSENNLPKASLTHHPMQVDHALDSLVKSMKWDEETFGLEYDLELFNIVAVDDFNMGVSAAADGCGAGCRPGGVGGSKNVTMAKRRESREADASGVAHGNEWAMENKSLNIFNSRLVLASPETATDMDYSRIEGVVGHEYFHNWTGNRVTCRDWFQLTLKEGLTEFSADMNSRPVKRIEDATMLRASQFTEDAGPMAHPIRPDSYIKMDNFYSVTVYEKGAEVVRLYATLLGKEGFRKGMDLYFKRHDGHAVTCDDFLAAMADANGADLSALGRWYGQAGTPRVEVTPVFEAGPQTLTLRVKQSTPPTPGQPDKQPVLIPLAVGLLGPDGHDLPLHLRGAPSPAVASAEGHTAVLRLEEAEQEFVFEHVASEPVVSVLRGFSAPVKVTVHGQTDEHLTFLFAHDTDPFNRWESGQRLSRKLLLQLYSAAQAANASSEDRQRLHGALAEAGGVPEALSAAFKALLTDKDLDGSFKAMAVSLPGGTELLDAIPDADPTLIHEVRHYVVCQLAARMRPELEAVVKENDSTPGEPYVFSATACARRALKNKALAMLSSLEDPEITANILQRFREATNMTDQIGALSCLVELCGPERELALAEFYAKWQQEPLVILKWLGLQAMSNAPGNVSLAKQLVDHPAFNIGNPNNCYSLFLGFARSPVNFHAANGSGYEFMADSVLRVDKLNHQVAARMVSAFTTFKQFDNKRQALMKAQLERIVATPGLSENVFEIASKSLA